MTQTCECSPEAGSATCELREPRGPAACPTCGKTGKKVETTTVRALLSVSLMEVGSEQYFFCQTRDCPTVYFTVDGGQEFAESHLRERVHQKHSDDPGVFVCYCFRHTPGTIRQEFAATGASEVVEAITAGIQAGQCACDIRNPQGNCCLGNVRAVVQQVTAGVTPGA